MVYGAIVVALATWLYDSLPLTRAQALQVLDAAQAVVEQDADGTHVHIMHNVAARGFVGWMNGVPSVGKVVRTLNAIEHLRTVDGDFGVSDWDFAGFHNVAELRRFWLLSKLTDASTPKIAAMPQLEELGIENKDGITEKSLMALGAATKLRGLRICWNSSRSISRAAADTLGACQNWNILI